MLIPSIDLMGGKIVQLVRGEKKALEFENFGEWVERFSRYPAVQLIDLDAAKRQGDNQALIADFCLKLPCQVGGGIRTREDARRVIGAGARRVIVGSSLVRDGAIDTQFAAELSAELGWESLVAAVDSRAGRVTIHGWKTTTEISPVSMMSALEEFVSAFLYTHVDTEGTLQGLPIDVVRDLRARTTRQLIAAGGIRSQQEIDELDAIGVDAVVGMAIYTGMVNV